MTGTHSPTAAVILRAPESRLAAHPDLFGASPGERAVSLAMALGSSPAWRRLRDRGRIAVRTEPEALIGVLGRFHEEDESLLRALNWQVEDSLERLRPVAYPDAEAACRLLALKLVDQLGSAAVSRCRLVGVPRGGLIVAAMLAYLLDVPQSRIGCSLQDGDGTAVVVDDCVLSGSRSRRWLRDNPGPQVVLAHLHSHPALRAAIESDPRVIACVAAADLHDHAPERQGGRYADWKRRWEARSPDDYWTGHPDHVCYPWNEPDTLVWNSATGVAEPAWNVVPPSHCLKNRPEMPGDVQIWSAEHEHRRVPPDALSVDMYNQVLLARVGATTCVELAGTAADFWRAMTTAEDAEEALRSLQELYRVDVRTLRADLRRFVERLTTMGLWLDDGVI